MVSSFLSDLLNSNMDAVQKIVKGNNKVDYLLSVKILIYSRNFGTMFHLICVGPPIDHQLGSHSTLSDGYD